MNTTSVSLPTNTPEDLFHVCRSRGNWFKDYPSSAINTITVSDVFWHEPPLFPAQYNISTHIIDRMVLIYGKSPEYLPIQTAWFAFLVSFRSSIFSVIYFFMKSTHSLRLIYHTLFCLSFTRNVNTDMTPIIEYFYRLSFFKNNWMFVHIFSVCHILFTCSYPNLNFIYLKWSE